MMTTIENRILESIDALTQAETRVARSLLSGYPGSALRGASGIATAAGASPASVTRFLTKLGFDSLRDFHEAVRSELDARLRSPFETTDGDDAGNGFIETVVRSQSHNVAQTLRRLTPELLASVRALLTEPSAVYTLGGRFSHSLAWYLAAHLQLVRPGVTVLTQESLADRLAHARRRSCLVAFDFRRYQPAIEFAAGYVKARRGHVVLITDPYVSPAARHADRTLVADIETPRLFDSYAPAVAMLDAIISDVVTNGPQQSQNRIRQVEEARALLDAARESS